MKKKDKDTEWSNKFIQLASLVSKRGIKVITECTVDIRLASLDSVGKEIRGFTDKLHIIGPFCFELEMVYEKYTPVGGPDIFKEFYQILKIVTHEYQ